MAGTFATDALAPDLLDGLTLDADDTVEGTAWEADWPQEVTFHLVLVDPDAADDATIQVLIQGCETSDFSTADVVTFASYPVILEAEAVTAASAPFELTTRITSKYVRAVAIVIDGTNGDWSGSTLTPHMRDYQRTRLNSAAPLA